MDEKRNRRSIGPMTSSRIRPLTLATLALLGAGLLGGRSMAQAPTVPIQGRVLDERGDPVAGAVVRLYRKEGPWSRSDPQVEEVISGPDGSFRLKAAPLAPGSPDQPNPARLVLVAEHAGHALGWKAVPGGPSFRGEIRLSDQRAERTITVTDAEGKPLAGATVAVMDLSDPSSASPRFRERLDIKPSDGPLTMPSNAAGQARFTNLPRTKSSFEANKPGYAATICFPEQNSIRLTPAAILEGTLTGPVGQPLSGVTVKLKADFMWHFVLVPTDARGHYRVDGLAARGWDMAAWQAGQVGNGKYKLWIEDQEFAIPTQSFTLEPNERRTLDLEADKAGVIRIKVNEAVTNKRVPGVRIWGFDAGGRRFDALTDAAGVATFHSLNAKVSLSIAGPPKGTFVLANLMDPWAKDSVVNFDFLGGEETETLILPQIGGRFVAVEGQCTRLDQTRAGGVTVHAATDPTRYVPPRQVDAAGGFAFEEVPAGRTLGVYAISDDGRLGGWFASKVTLEGRPEPPIRLPLRPTVAVDLTLTEEQGNPLRAQEFTFGPKPRNDLVFLRRFARTDERGRARLDRIVLGLNYHVGRIPPGLAHQIEQASQPQGRILPMRAAINKDSILAAGEGP